MSSHFRHLVRRGIGGIKPGWSRISLPWYASEADLDFILAAAEFIATHGKGFRPALSILLVIRSLAPCRLAGRRDRSATAQCRGPHQRPGSLDAGPAISERRLEEERRGYLAAQCDSPKLTRATMLSGRFAGCPIQPRAVAR
jgi:hypothetical protein